MTMPGDDAVFVDTNVLVYAAVAESPLHEVARQELRDLRLNGRQIIVSNQVVREFLACLTRPGWFPAPPKRSEVLQCATSIRAQYLVLPDDASVGLQLIELLRQVDCGGRQVHDANIVATMITAGVNTLLTENRRDFKRFDTHINLLSLSEAPTG